MAKGHKVAAESPKTVKKLRRLHKIAKKILSGAILSDCSWQFSRSVALTKQQHMLTQHFKNSMAAALSISMNMQDNLSIPCLAHKCLRLTENVLNLS